MSDLLRAFWAEPRAANATGPRALDLALVAALLALAGVEAAVRPELTWTAPALWFGVVSVPTLLWRRTRPLAMVFVVFLAAGVVEGLELARGVAGADLYAMVFVLLLPYSLFRWGSGREALLGAPLMFAKATLCLASDQPSLGEAIGGVGVLLAAMALGTAARFRERARTRELEQVKLREREQLARDLHDTVAHHVSAIAIRAQAGLASADAHARTAALEVVEEEASRTLAEMRAMVRTLRRDEPAERAPQPRIVDLVGLAEGAPEGLPLQVDLEGDVEAVAPSVAAAVYRLAQEAITNARRHARRATRIVVGVTADESSVRLRVNDDGEGAPGADEGGGGWGLLGMVERAKLLGGRCHAGPDPERGWTVTAVLPRNGPAA